jgi:hypothetical protein
MLVSSPLIRCDIGGIGGIGGVDRCAIDVAVASMIYWRGTDMIFPSLYPVKLALRQDI